jgi:CHAD domain-containing protein
MHEARRHLKKLDWTIFERQLRAVEAALRSVPTDAPTRAAAESAIHGQMARLHLDVLARRGSLSREREPSRALHRLRLKLKEYRYSLDVVGATLPASARELGVTTAHLQQVLGAAHDASLLAGLVRDELDLERPAMRAPLEELCSQLERERDAAEVAATQALREARFDWPLP